MRQLIVTEFVSADGVAEAPGDDPSYANSGWSMTSVEFLEEAYELKGREQQEAGALLLGRRSYEMFAPVWPTMEEFAEYNQMPRYVVSTSLEAEDSRWPATILRSVSEVAALKEGEGAPILVHASLELGHALAAAGLVDRYHLVIYPVLLGSGQRVFSESAHPAQQLALVEHATYANGVQMVVYDVVRDN